MISIKTYILIFLFEIGFGIKFNIIGEISISELFLLIYTPFILCKICWNKSKELKQITIAYTILLGVEIFSEIIVSNGISNSLKGLAITIVSYLHFIFLFYNLTKDKKLILTIIFSQIVMKLIFGSQIEEQSTEDILAGEAAAYLKFYVAPLSILILLVFSIIFNNKNMPILFLLFGIGLVVLGARSSGVMVILAGMISYLMEHKSLIANKKLLIGTSLILVCLSYGLYVYYVNKVLAGEIISGNNKQLLICKNPYNPIELLMSGRREVWVGWQAFMDKFWFGHGSWPHDTTGHYQRLIYEMSDQLPALTKNRVNYNFLIPSHSVIIGAGMMNGIFAFFAMSYIVFYFLKKGIISLKKCEQEYLLVLAYFVYNIFWDALFSPFSHFRQTFPIAFAIILTIYVNIKYSHNKNTQSHFIE